jgi:hypothetical protein
MSAMGWPPLSGGLEHARIGGAAPVPVEGGKQSV